MYVYVYIRICRRIRIQIDIILYIIYNIYTHSGPVKDRNKTSEFPAVRSEKAFRCSDKAARGDGPIVAGISCRFKRDSIDLLSNRDFMGSSPMCLN
jgi:hypothetical protein